VWGRLIAAMAVCPLCENTQAAGAECDVCGRPLPQPPGLELELVPELPPPEGLETSQAAASEGEALPPMAELERTLHAPVAALAGEPVPDLEATRTAPVEVGLDVAPDLERIGDEIPVDAPTPFPVLVICRYCHAEAAPGERRCARCGMRLPAAAGEGAPREVAPRLCSCGAPVRGPRCPACGARTSAEAG
jgi:hypothetical protein